MTLSSFKKLLGCTSFWLWFSVAILAYPVHLEWLNMLGPSSNYYARYIEGAARQQDGTYVAYLGDKIYVHYDIVRHQINGNCLLPIYRYGENVGGPEAGKRHLLDYVERRFRGGSDFLRLRWPDDGLVLGYGKKFNSADPPKLIEDKDDPLIPPGQVSQELAMYVVSRYDCNFMDWIFPRYIQGGPNPNETERLYMIVKRKG